MRLPPVKIMTLAQYCLEQDREGASSGDPAGLPCWKGRYVTHVRLLRGGVLGWGEGQAAEGSAGPLQCQTRSPSVPGASGVEKVDRRGGRDVDTCGPPVDCVDW